ncbi:cupin domain-containing protein [Flavilitoribacter nigricans]|uniref:Cupin n=1 Tax=Flavilitoribacter nigricans (strain ATCC 23147 / DSM 23189 / NBRC 102662 / NCIMB 1420 / SS-2) TaxID=1122177 RepID=A0A2D0MZ43_FLAN2|nr:cupin domain-containing protein [Flavilitoribacter nigricans]PHN01398.1 cupin [Flavilitoribacter nigricans DSM 23189 = NBRC 102662]
MDSYWKFTKADLIEKEQVSGRDHYWHFNPEISQQAETILVKVVVPVGGGHPFHRHPEMNEILYVIKGRAEQWVEDEMQFMETGDSVYIAPDVIHATYNAGDEELEFLAVLSPAAGWGAGTIDESDHPDYAHLRK